MAWQRLATSCNRPARPAHAVYYSAKFASGLPYTIATVMAFIRVLRRHEVLSAAHDGQGSSKFSTMQQSGTAEIYAAATPIGSVQNISLADLLPDNIATSTTPVINNTFCCTTLS